MIKLVTIIALLAPLLGSMIAGFLGKSIGKKGAHSITILGVAASFVAAIILLNQFVLQHHTTEIVNLYDWIVSGSFSFTFGFWLDPLTVIMMTIVTFVSLLVHIYSMGYMKDDDGYQRFFSYMSLFTFMMLVLVTANNFAQLFFGWEGVGLVSYLLIGFWFNKESAANGSLKAFLVNRVGDLGFILGLAALLDNVGSLNYLNVFLKAHGIASTMVSLGFGAHASLVTVICILLFIGAMGKSAQIPLHVWLPESMEGPTPISALIHAATMVTAGVFMVARLSPLFELSTTALSLVMIVGATGALFMGLLALAEFDIKRVIAYSTMSQLGYMMAANGASAFSAGIFHLLTHACFKALLFLAAGSVIVAMHHEQDVRKMGGLRKYLPITYITFLIGALALAAIPPFAGFYSKDAIIEAVQHATIFGSGYAYVCLLLGALVTGLYIFRIFFLSFHGKEKFTDMKGQDIQEKSWSIKLPLILLAIPSVILGAWLAKPMLYSGSANILSGSLFVSNTLNTMQALAADFKGFAWQALLSVQHLAFWFSVVGIVLAWVFYLKAPQLPEQLASKFSWCYNILQQRYGFDRFNDWFFVKGTLALSQKLYHLIDEKIVDGYMVNGTGRCLNGLSKMMRTIQSGYLFHYALVMVVALVALLVWVVA